MNVVAKCSIPLFERKKRHNRRSYFRWGSSRGGLEVEQWSDNRTLSFSVDQSPLWALNIVSFDCDIFVVLVWEGLDVW